MKSSTLLAIGAAVFSSAKPVPVPAGPPPGSFSITDFKYYCMSECFWDFHLTVNGNFLNHPGFDTPITCSGSLAALSFDNFTCTPIANSPVPARVNVFITIYNMMNLRYTVQTGYDSVEHYFYGEQKVHSDVVMKPYPEKFVVPETKTNVTPG